MKKVFCLLALLLVYNHITAQNVGVKTTTPQYSLHVNESAFTNNFMLITNSTTGQLSGDGLIMGNSGLHAIISNFENGSLRFGTNNFTRVTIDESGDVGI